MKKELLSAQIDSLSHQAESPDCIKAVGVVGEKGTEYSFNFEATDRLRIVQELRDVKREIASATNGFVEFGLNDNWFCVELDKEEKDDM